MLTHSVLPRGGVVHALEVSDALAERGHVVDLCAPDPEGSGLFRQPRMGGNDNDVHSSGESRDTHAAARCRFIPIPADRVAGGVAEMVAQRIDEWLHYFEHTPGALDYDIYHAQDSISANALATLVARGMIPSYVRTVHHLDTFADSRLTAWQTRGFMAAAHVFCVSAGWRDALRRDYGIEASLVNNGVDTQRFFPKSLTARPTDTEWRSGAGVGPVFLSVGGVEARKNTVQALAAFARIRGRYPQAQWLIAGGASLLDHSAYAARFREAAAAAQLSIGIGQAITLLGRVDDDAMPALFRFADALLFPSLTEGFGLVVLEALASATPVVVSRIAPFTEYLPPLAAEWADPNDPASIAAAMLRAVDATTERSEIRCATGLAVCDQFGWSDSARIHLDLYHARREAPAVTLENAHA
jgi:glycosyltransferase-like protein